MNACEVCGKVTGTEKYCEYCDAMICNSCLWNPATRTWAAARRATRQLQGVFARLLGKVA